MYTSPPKKLLIMNILDIFRRYTDADHRLSQKEIVDILRREYEMKVDRKAVRRNILDLIEFGYEIEYSETVRMMPDPKTGEPEETFILSDFYLLRDFTDAELRLLIDGLLFWELDAGSSSLPTRTKIAVLPQKAAGIVSLRLLLA